MNKRLPPGKISWDKIAKKLQGRLPPEVILGPAQGEDAALVRIADETWAVASDPITFTSQEAGKLSVIVNANDIAVRGARPLYYIAVLLVSPETAGEDTVTALLDEIRAACERMGVYLIGGHTEVAPGLPHTVIVGTMLGKIIERPITTGGLRAGDLVGMTKWAGLEGTSILLKEFGERLRESCGEDFFAEARELLGEEWLSVVPEATLAAACPHVTALHDVTEGGIGEALHEMARASGLHIHADPASVPVHPQTKRICSELGMHPFGLLGSGSLLVGCAQDGKETLERMLADHGIEFSWLGKAELPGGQPSSTLPRFEQDEILKAGLLDGVAACVFDMDGTLIDSEYDWSGIRDSLGITAVSIVDHLNSLEDKEREEKWSKLREIEREATLAAHVKPGAADLLALLEEKGVKVALVTNNSDENVYYLLEKFALCFDEVITRDSGMHKPSGAPIAEAMRRLGVSPERTLCVGDSPFDIVASREAGCNRVCILYDDKNRCSANADISFADIDAFIRYLKLVL